MKVWIVFHCDPECMDVREVFDSEVKADKYIEENKAAKLTPCIEEWEVK